MSCKSVPAEPPKWLWEMKLQDFRANLPWEVTASSLEGCFVWPRKLSVPTMLTWDPHRGSTKYQGKYRGEQWPPLRPSPADLKRVMARKMQHELPPIKLPHGDCPGWAWPLQQGLTSIVHHSLAWDTAHSPSALELLAHCGQPKTSSVFQGFLKPHFSAVPYLCWGGNSLLPPDFWGLAAPQMLRELKEARGCAGGRAGDWVLPQQHSLKGITFLKSSCLTFLSRTFLSYTFIF